MHENFTQNNLFFSKYSQCIDLDDMKDKEHVIFPIRVERFPEESGKQPNNHNLWSCRGFL
jgi:hypothetical protein